MRGTLLGLLLGLGFIVPAGAGPTDHKLLKVSGRVVDGTNAPVGDVVVEAQGTREAIAISDPDGHYELLLDLGAVRTLSERPFGLWIRARREGWHVHVVGGEPAIGLELSVEVSGNLPQLVARSNFGLIADAVLDALAPPGERTASIQARFVAAPGETPDSSSALSAVRHAVALDEPWLVAPPPAPAGPAPSHAPAPATTGAPASPIGGGPVATLQSEPERAPAPGHQKKEKKPHPKPEKKPKAPSEAESGKGGASAARGTVKPPAPPAAVRLTHADSVRLARKAEEDARVAAAEAARDSLWRVRHAWAIAQKARGDSLRALRDAAEDSLRRVRFGLPPRSQVAVNAAPAKRDSLRATSKTPRPDKIARPTSAKKEQQQSSREEKKKKHEKTPRPEPRGEVATNVAAPVPPASDRARPSPSSPTLVPGPAAARPGSPRTIPAGLQRVRPGGVGDTLPLSESAAMSGSGGEGCGCRVKGTVELEFHHLLSSPMRVEVAIPGQPMLRDTIELFMGSPREFEFPRVTCGTWSLSVRPFSQRPFVVITPTEVAPFECRPGSLRQVRIVLDPR